MGTTPVSVDLEVVLGFRGMWLWVVFWDVGIGFIWKYRN